MDRRELPPSLKNYAFEVIQANGMDPTEFRWTLVRGSQAGFQVSHLEHVRTGFFVLFDLGGAGYYPTAWPGRKFEAITEGSLEQVIQSWAARIGPEVQAPDLWTLSAEQKRIATDPSQANAQFTADEQRQLEAGLAQLEEFVYQSEPDLPDDKRQAVKARFGYLRAAVARVGRIDWTSLVVGQLFSMVAEKIITVQTFTAAYNVAANLLTKFLASGTAVAGRLLGS
jgi:hypothetical protein